MDCCRADHIARENPGVAFSPVQLRQQQHFKKKLHKYFPKYIMGRHKGNTEVVGGQIQVQQLSLTETARRGLDTKKGVGNADINGQIAIP